VTPCQPTNGSAPQPNGLSEAACSTASADSPPARRGRLTLIHGCMFSGKTSKLIHLLEQRDAATAVAVKHVRDTRYQIHRIVTHDQKAYPARVAECAAVIPDALGRRTAFVAVDEGHFFGMDLLVVVGRLRDRGVDLAVTTLDYDSWGRPFPCFLELAQDADECLSGVVSCARCGSRADRTQRLTPIIDGQMVGGPEAYEPRCQACWQPPPAG